MDIESAIAEVQRTLCSSAELRVESSSNRTLSATVSDETLDRYDSIILQRGWKLAAFKANPVVQPFHDYGVPPVGRALNVWVEPKPPRLRMRIQFAPTPLGEELFALYQGGFMKAFSVGFLPLRTRDLTEEEIAKLKKNGAQFTGRFTPRIYEESELLETSTVPVPANPAALVDTFKPSAMLSAASEIEKLAPRYAECIRRAVEDNAGNHALRNRVRNDFRKFKARTSKLDDPDAIKLEMIELAEKIKDNLAGTQLQYDGHFMSEVVRTLEAISRRLKR